MPIKMILTDLDGTLLRGDKTLSAYTQAVLQACHARGIRIVLATARPIRAVEMLRLQVPVDAAVYHNGAVVHVGGACVLRRGIPPEETERIALAALRADASAQICVEIEDRLYGNFDPSHIWPGIEICPTDFTNLPHVPADKMILPMATLAEMQAVARALPDCLYIEMSENTVGMIMHKQATKAGAAAFLAAHYQLALADVAAFGDDYNDIEMLRVCGTGVAVANAIDEAKAAADFVCEPNERDGVARWLAQALALPQAGEL